MRNSYFEQLFTDQFGLTRAYFVGSASSILDAAPGGASNGPLTPHATWAWTRWPIAIVILGSASIPGALIIRRLLKKCITFKLLAGEYYVC